MTNRKILPEINKEYGNLTVISDTDFKSSDGKSIWVMKCSCGRVENVLSKRLRRKINPKTKCAYCLRSESKSNMMKDPSKHKKLGTHSGVGDITKTHYLNFKANATKRNLLWDVSIDFLWDLYLKQNKRCALTGLPISFAPLTHPGGGQSRVPANKNAASLDRIDSSIGYIESNLQFVHKDINFMKASHSTEYFIYLCRNVINIYDNPERSHSDMERATTIQ